EARWMKMTLRDALTLGFGIIGLGWYYVCIVVIGFRTSTDPADAAFRAFMSLSITTISVTLATFVGMLLGIRSISDRIQQGVNQVPAAAPPALQQLATDAKGTLMQWIACGVYAGSLLLALYCWWYYGEKTDPAIVNLGKSFLGLIGGALTVLINQP